MAITPQGYALLNTIAGPESAGAYNVIYGGQRFNDYSDHPRQAVRIQSGPNRGRTSSAAGKYQFLGSTWDEAKNALGLRDFSPQSQDEAAWWLAQRDYRTKTGRDLQSDLASGNPRTLNNIARTLSTTWTSLPSGIEQGISGSAFQQAYARNLSGANNGNSALSAIQSSTNAPAIGNPSNRLALAPPIPATRTQQVVLPSPAPRINRVRAPTPRSVEDRNAARGGNIRPPSPFPRIQRQSFQSAPTSLNQNVNQSVGNPSVMAALLSHRAQPQEHANQRVRTEHPEGVAGSVRMSDEGFERLSEQFRNISMPSPAPPVSAPSLYDPLPLPVPSTVVNPASAASRSAPPIPRADPRSKMDGIGSMPSFNDLRLLGGGQALAEPFFKPIQNGPTPAPRLARRAVARPYPMPRLMGRGPVHSPPIISQRVTTPSQQPKLYQSGGYVYRDNPEGGYTRTGTISAPRRSIFGSAGDDAIRQIFAGSREGSAKRYNPDTNKWETR